MCSSDLAYGIRVRAVWPPAVVSARCRSVQRPETVSETRQVSVRAARTPCASCGGTQRRRRVRLPLRSQLRPSARPHIAGPSSDGVRAARTLGVVRPPARPLQRVRLRDLRPSVSICPTPHSSRGCVICAKLSRGMPQASLIAAPGSRRGKSRPAARTGGYVVAWGDPCDSLRIV